MPEAQPGQEQRMGLTGNIVSAEMDALRAENALYREALEVLLLVKDAVDYRGDACHPAEMVGAVLDKCILERIDAVLSRVGDRP